jgi:phenylacetate-coenzyme A ligase PaaK-like adenylate-forming protein
MNSILVETEVKKAVYEAGQAKIDELATKVSGRIMQVIGIKVPVNIMPQDSIERSIGKAKRIIDER